MDQPSPRFGPETQQTSEHESPNLAEYGKAVREVLGTFLGVMPDEVPSSEAERKFFQLLRALADLIYESKVLSNTFAAKRRVKDAAVEALVEVQGLHQRVEESFRNLQHVMDASESQAKLVEQRCLAEAETAATHVKELEQETARLRTDLRLRLEDNTVAQIRLQNLTCALAACEKERDELRRRHEIGRLTAKGTERESLQLRGENSTLRQTGENLRTQNRALEAKLAHAQDELGQIKQACNAVIAEMEENKAKDVTEASEVISALKKEWDGMKEELSQRLEEAKDSITKLKNTLANMEKSHETECAMLRKENGKLTTELAESLEHNGNLSRNVEEAKDKLASTVASLRMEHSVEYSKMKGETEKLIKSLAEARSQTKTAIAGAEKKHSAEIAAMKEASAKLAKRIEELGEASARREDEVITSIAAMEKKHSEECAVLREENARLHGSLEEEKRGAESLRSRTEDEKTALEARLADTIAQLRARINEGTTRLLALLGANAPNIETEDVPKTFERIFQGIETLLKRLDESVKKLDDAKTSENGLNKRLVQLEAEFNLFKESAEKTRSGLQQDVAKLKESEKRAAETVDKLTDKLVNSGEENEQLEGNIEALSDESKKLRAALSACQKTVNEILAVDKKTDAKGALDKLHQRLVREVSAGLVHDTDI